MIKDDESIVNKYGRKIQEEEKEVTESSLSLPKNDAKPPEVS